MRTVEQELATYPTIETLYTKVTSVNNTGTENLTQFTVGNGTVSWTRRKLRTAIF
jgi:hypothetical protein